MSEIYTVIVGILAILAISGLFVGVTNDAVNFLNSALGSKAASMRTILLVASAGILLGVITSSGMMEVARSGMFNPELFTFHEVMMLYLGVMFANVILLGLYNSWGLPTSTTVSLIFCLLGSAVAVSVYKITSDPALGVGTLGDYINSSRAMGVVSAILLSVVIAFSCGSFIMYVSRVIFSFRYTVVFRRFGSLWCGVSLTAIVYFAVFKGLKTLLAGNAFIQLINNHLLAALGICWVICSLLLFFIQRFKINILRITILSGVFALALAFAGNDLVNFIGVPVAGFDAYSFARATGDTQMLMAPLANNVPANMTILLIAGGIMIVALWASKEAVLRVTKTELSLSAQGDDGQERYDSSIFSRTLVRIALSINNGIERIVPAKIRAAVGKRFEYEDVEHSGAPYDMIRATVNLTTSALLISLATSLKLPLSTTYVCFMVAMGSSLADRAWGRESAVYRISGVMTVIAGWFVTALGGFLISFIVGLVLIYGGIATFVVVTVLCAWFLYRSQFAKKNKTADAEIKAETNEDIIASLRDDVCCTMENATKIYDRTLIAVLKENHKVLRDMVKEANDLFYQSRDRKYTLLPTLKRLQSGDVNTAHYYVQVVDYLNEMTKALVHITRPAFEHIDNSHEGLSVEQTRDLMAINDDVEAIYRHINLMLRDGDFSDIEMVLGLRDQLFESIADAIKSELTRINEAKSNTKASMLYLTILTETKNMVLQSRNLLKSQQYFLKHRTEKKWIK
ncbi:inorganic phosphate transporter [uncultured Alistipes sp.]|jgi:phosphate/sulfate permease|uniref:inorganic phosphate transporter n=1 Tax=uncultured Alistipes sp. TaxID=538949 RepID=UPI0025D3E755|nr:inorganic phosphate transporter [uncultured Alistipes sp.]